MIDAQDHARLSRCIELARQALEGGNDPFGSILVSADGRTLFEAMNGAGDGDDTQHPEFEIARWAAEHMQPAERAASTVYTSGEHCPMCSAAHGWVGLGRIVYAASARQLASWHAEMGAAASPVRSLPIQEVAPDVPVDGPADDLFDVVRQLHARRHAFRTR